MENNGDLAEIFTELSLSAIIHVALIVVGALLLIALSQRLLSWVANRLAGAYRLYLLASVPLLRLLIIAVAIVLIIPQIVEPTVANMVALLGASGLVLGFGLKDYFSSLIAGIVMLYEMPYRPGDWIEVGGAYGEVKQIGMRTVEIITPDDTTVSIPHLKMWDNLIFNANDGATNLMCVADFYLNPHHDGARVKQALYDVALTSPYVHLEQPIAVVVMEKPWGTHYRLKGYPIDLRQQFHFISDLTIRGKAALNRLDLLFAQVPVVGEENFQHEKNR